MRHDACQDTLAKCMRDAGVESGETTPGYLFADPVADFSRLPPGDQDFLIPDIKAHMKLLEQGMEVTDTHLFELKSVGKVADYLDTGGNKPCNVATNMAKKQRGDYKRRAKVLDKKYNHTQEGAVGPIEETLKDVGIVTGLAFGPFCDASESMANLTRSLVELAVPRI